MMKECIVLTDEVKENVASVISHWDWLRDEQPVGYEAILELVDAMGLEIRWNRRMDKFFFSDKED
jgi:hypothetical protein